MFFIMIQISFCALANRETDSLIHIVHEYEKKAHFESDTNYIKTLIEIAKTFGTANPDSTLLFGRKAYELSTRYNYYKGIISSAFTIVPIYSRQQDIQNLIQIGNKIIPIDRKSTRLNSSH